MTVPPGVENTSLAVVAEGPPADAEDVGVGVWDAVFGPADGEAVAEAS
jgi:hypothetical protein